MSFLEIPAAEVALSILPDIFPRNTLNLPVIPSGISAGIALDILERVLLGGIVGIPSGITAEISPKIPFVIS